MVVEPRFLRPQYAQSVRARTTGDDSVFSRTRTAQRAFTICYSTSLFCAPITLYPKRRLGPGQQSPSIGLRGLRVFAGFLIVPSHMDFETHEKSAFQRF